VLGQQGAGPGDAAAALDYVKALSRGTRANCWELAEEAGHRGPHRMQALLTPYNAVVGEVAGRACSRGGAAAPG
jgi:hypothetical protein